MEVYRRLVSCAGVEDLRQLRRDLADAYGPIPPEVDVVLDVAEVRLWARTLGIDSIILMGLDIVFAVRDFSAAQGVFKGAAGTVRVPDAHTVYWRPGEAYCEMPTLLRVLLKRLRQAARAV
jgi:hypothetical protein